MILRMGDRRWEMGEMWWLGKRARVEDSTLDIVSAALYLDILILQREIGSWGKRTDRK